MQPMLMIRSAVPGMVFVNGRFAGEADEGSAVSLPVSARGTLYIELKPLEGGYLPLARRIALSAGKPVAASMEGQRGLSCVSWPGNVLEIGLAPERARQLPPTVQTLALDAVQVRLIQGEESLLELTRGQDVTVHRLPDGAKPPEVRQYPDGSMTLLGETDEGQKYLMALGGGPGEMLLSITAGEIELGDDGSVRALVDIKDDVGHALLMHWTRSGGGYVPGETEMMWAQGRPAWPDTPEGTALAALQAALLGLSDEAGAYFTPGFPVQANDALREAINADGCVRLKYPMQDGRQAVGLIRLAGENSAMVQPVLYHALPMGGSQGAWRLDQLELLA